MAFPMDPSNGMRRPLGLTPSTQTGLANMAGEAARNRAGAGMIIDAVERPARLAAPVAPAAPAYGAANGMGSGSAPIGNGGISAPGTAGVAANAGRAAAMAGTARRVINGGAARLGGAAATVGAIADSADQDATAAYAKRFGVAEPTGDGSAGDVAKFAALRAGGFASDLGNRLTFGAAGKLFRDDEGKLERMPVTAPPAGTAVAAPGAANAVQTPQTTTAAPTLAGTPLFGAEGVRKVVQPGGAPLYTNATSNAQDDAFRASKGTVSGYDGAGANAVNQRALDIQTQISSMRAGLRDRGDTGAYLKGAAQVASLTPGGGAGDVQDQINRITGNGRKTLTAAGAGVVSDLMRQQQAQGSDNARLAEQARQANQQAQISREAQDVTLRGQDINQRTAAAAARQRQLQDDREFGIKQEEVGLKRQELGVKRTEAGAKRETEDFAQRESATKNIAESFRTQFTTKDAKGNTVVDEERAAKFTNGVQTFFGQKQAELTKKVQTGEASPEEAKMLDTMNRKGLAALDKADLTNIETNIKRGERLKESAGILGSKYIESNDPNAYGIKGRRSNLFGSDTIEFNNGSTGREKDFKYDEPANSFLPDFKTETDVYGVKRKLK